jgi:hypothetical protein
MKEWVRKRRAGKSRGGMGCRRRENSGWEGRGGKDEGRKIYTAFVMINRIYNTLISDTLQCSKLQCSTLQYSTHSKLQYSTVRYMTVHHTTSQHSTAKQSKYSLYPPSL